MWNVDLLNLREVTMEGGIISKDWMNWTEDRQQKEEKWWELGRHEHSGTAAIDPYRSGWQWQAYLGYSITKIMR